MKTAIITVGLMAAATLAAAPAQADSLGAVCPDPLWMKISNDAATGQRMVCGGAYPDPTLRWISTAAGSMASNFNDLPTVGPAGSNCKGVPPMTFFGQTPDGYVVWCVPGPKVLLPGGGDYQQASTSPVWSLYSP